MMIKIVVTTKMSIIKTQIHNNKNSILNSIQMLLCTFRLIFKFSFTDIKNNFKSLKIKISLEYNLKTIKN